jgi:ribosomal protein S18 acetylase RimI-like enzyme
LLKKDFAPVPKYRIRPAELEDLARCLEIDASYLTSYVWQMQENFEESVELDSEETANRARPKVLGKTSKTGLPGFRMEMKSSRLPHPLAVPAPMNDQQLLAEWKRTDHLLVAEITTQAGDETTTPEEAEAMQALPLLATDPKVQTDIVGYIGLAVDGPRHVAWITTGAVQLNYRRQGIGTGLLNEARSWTDRYRLRSLLVELQTKNYPAINFFQKNNFFFCGYNNAYYATREIALFFGKRLEKFS